MLKRMFGLFFRARSRSVSESVSLLDRIGSWWRAWRGAHSLIDGFRKRAGGGANRFELRRVSPTVVQQKKEGVDFFGFLGDSTGLGVAARSYVSALQLVQVPVSTFAVEHFTFRAHPQGGRERWGAGGAHRAQIFHLNADHLLRFFYGHGLPYLHDAYNIGLWVWELASFRPDWAQCFGAIDEVWTPSEFCRRAIDSISPIPVTTMPHAVTVDRNKAVYDRTYFGFPEDCFIFAAIFDVGSLMERKNPELLIRAFKAVFGSRKDVILALKYHGSFHDLQRVGALRGMADQDNVRLIDRVFDEQELISFKSVIDCFVSAHRSEGFGLNIAEAMLMGKPVIATGYSGNMDYMNSENSYPVEYRLAALQKSYGPYPRGYLWADPSYDHLCSLLRHVVENQDEARIKAARAAEQIAKSYSLEAVGLAIKDRLAAIGIFDEGFGRNLTDQMRRQRSARRPPLATGASDGRKAARWSLDFTPTISVLVPVYNVERKFLAACIDSVRRQSYPHWELVLYDEGSTNSDTKETLASYKGADSRIKIVFGGANRGIAEATNAATEMTTGDYVAFLDNDDEIDAGALLEAARAINANPDADFFYTDEDKISESNRYCETYFKPDWSPEHLESCMYVLHLMIVKRDLLLQIGGLRKEFDGAQDYDLALRLGRVAKRIVHIPKVLYHWRKTAGSAAAVVDAKPWGLDAAKRVLEDHVRSSGRDAIVEPGKLPGLFRVRWRIAPDTTPTLVIFTDNQTKRVIGRGKINLFDHFLRSILEKTVYRDGFKVLAVDNGNLRDAQVDMVHAAGGRVVSYAAAGAAFNFASKANFALRHVGSELVVLLNDDMEVISPGWLEALIEFAQLPTTGAVGAKLYHPDGRIQHCGMIAGINGNMAHIYHRSRGDLIGYNAYTHVIRNYLAVTGACMATRKSLIEEVGGFDESFAVDYNDVDLCLKMHTRGFRNIYTPFAELYHFEGATQPRRTPSEQERRLFSSRWEEYLSRDPFYNDNLPRNRHDFRGA